MNQAVPDCLVSGYEHLIDGLWIPDPDDRHVLATATRVGAQAIVTLNLKDFPARTLDGFGLFAKHPDDFILDLADLEPGVVIAVAKQQRAALAHPPFTAETFVDCLRRQGLVGVAAFLEDEGDLI